MGNCCLTGSSRRKVEYGAIAKSPQKLRDRQESQLLLEHDMGEKQSREAPPPPKQQPIKQSRSFSSSSDSSSSDGDSDDDRGHSHLKQSSFSVPHLKGDVDPNAKIGGVDNPAAELVTEKIQTSRGADPLHDSAPASTHAHGDASDNPGPHIIRPKFSAKKRTRAPTEPGKKPFPLEAQESVEALSYSAIREEVKEHPEMLNNPSHSPKLLRTAIPPHLHKNDFQRNKSSSTSTLFMNSTIKAPDNDEIVVCMSRALYWAIKKSEATKRKRLNDAFSEDLYPLDDRADTKNSPTEEIVHKFLSLIFHGESLSAECGVMGMAYIDRLIALTGITLCAVNWRRIVLAAIILASKVWEDQAVWNVDFVSVFPKVTVKDLNNLERNMLNALQFNVSLKASVYAKYYFELRSLSDRDPQHFPLKPLDKDGAARLEEKSHTMEKKAKPKKVTRSQSLDDMGRHISHTPVTLPQ